MLMNSHVIGAVTKGVLFIMDENLRVIGLLRNYKRLFSLDMMDEAQFLQQKKELLDELAGKLEKADAGNDELLKEIKAIKEEGIITESEFDGLQSALLRQGSAGQEAPQSTAPQNTFRASIPEMPAAPASQGGQAAFTAPGTQASFTVPGAQAAPGPQAPFTAPGTQAAPAAPAAPAKKGIDKKIIFGAIGVIVLVLILILATGGKKGSDDLPDPDEISVPDSASTDTGTSMDTSTNTVTPSTQDPIALIEGEWTGLYVLGDGEWLTDIDVDSTLSIEDDTWAMTLETAADGQKKAAGTIRYDSLHEGLYLYQFDFLAGGTAIVAYDSSSDLLILYTDTENFETGMSYFR